MPRHILVLQQKISEHTPTQLLSVTPLPTNGKNDDDWSETDLIIDEDHLDDMDTQSGNQFVLHHITPFLNHTISYQFDKNTHRFDLHICMYYLHSSTG